MDWERLLIRKPGLIGVSRWNDLVAAVRAATVQSFVGGAVSRNAGGTTLFTKGGAGGAAAAADHPFRLVTRPKPGAETTVVQGGVILESSLYLSLRPNDKTAITGLLNADRTAGWFDLIGNDAVWLGVVFDSSGDPTFVGIDSWGQSDVFEIDEDAWSGNNGYCEDDGGDPPVHQTSRKLIAYTVAGDDGLPVPTQVMFRDQVLRNVCIDGRPARYPFDHEGGYPL